MFETIVWATDGSELADRALLPVMELARRHHARIVAVHANDELAPSEEPDLVAKISGQVAELRELGFAAELKLVDGTRDAAALVTRAAQEVDADLIVVGTHEARIGCPVLSIPPASRVPATA
jgi:nucleotide-binding universal stress UspA family protein